MREVGEWRGIDTADTLEDALTLASVYAERLENEDRVRIANSEGIVII